MKLQYEYEITPEELFFMAVALEAEYIDYEYFAAMPDVQKNYELHKATAMQSLEDRGLIEEDFSGNLQIEDGFGQALDAMLFGRTECNIDVDEQRFKLHLHDGNMVLARLDGNIGICGTDIDSLCGMLEGKAFMISCADVDRGEYAEEFTADAAAGGSWKSRMGSIIKGECCA